MIDKGKIVKGFGIAGKAICEVVLSAFGINEDDRHDGLQGDTGQENGIRRSCLKSTNINNI